MVTREWLEGILRERRDLSDALGTKATSLFTDSILAALSEEVRDPTSSISSEYRRLGQLDTDIESVKLTHQNLRHRCDFDLTTLHRKTADLQIELRRLKLELGSDLKLTQPPIMGRILNDHVLDNAYEIKEEILQLRKDIANLKATISNLRVEFRVAIAENRQILRLKINKANTTIINQSNMLQKQRTEQLKTKIQKKEEELNEIDAMLNQIKKACQDIPTNQMTFAEAFSAKVEKKREAMANSFINEVSKAVGSFVTSVPEATDAINQSMVQRVAQLNSEYDRKLNAIKAERVALQAKLGEMTDNLRTMHESVTKIDPLDVEFDESCIKDRDDELDQVFSHLASIFEK